MTIGFGGKIEENPNQRYIGTYVEIINSSKPRIMGLWKEGQGDHGYLSPFADTKLEEGGKKKYFLNDDSRGYRFIIYGSDIKPTSLENITEEINILNTQEENRIKNKLKENKS